MQIVLGSTVQFAEQPHLVAAPDEPWPSTADAASGTDLAGDYRAVSAQLGLTADDLPRQNHAALDAAWLPAEEKAAVRARLQDAGG